MFAKRLFCVIVNMRDDPYEAIPMIPGGIKDDDSVHD